VGVGRPGVHGLHELDAPLLEARLAVGEVEVPEPLEPRVVAQGPHGAEAGAERRAPAVERLDVVRGEVLDVDRREPGAVRDEPTHDLARREAAAREDQRVDEAALALLELVRVVVDRDRLQRHEPVGLQEGIAAAEERGQVAPADRLDHLDGDEAVVAAAELAVVLQAQVDPVREARLVDPPACQRVLLAADRRRRHVRPVLPGGVDRERAPARADLDEPQAGAELELAAEPVHLLDLRGLQVGPGRGEDRARVAHRRVEEEREEVVGQVVVRGDLAPGAGDGVARAVADVLDRRQEVAEARPEAVERRHVARADGHEGDEVRAAPAALGVALADAEGPAQELAPDPGVVELELAPQRRAGHAEAVLAAVGLPDEQLPVVRGTEDAEGDRAGGVVGEQAGHGAGQRSGCGWCGTPLAASSSAWE
jgi:hypothetical protein